MRLFFLVHALALFLPAYTALNGSLDSLVAGLRTLTHPQLADPRATINALLEQYVGILPPVTVEAIRNGTFHVPRKGAR